MTRETAIKGLKAFRREFSGYEPNEEMFDMAIKALEQEPTTKNDLGVDCISRKEALEIITQIDYAYSLKGCELISHLPTVYPESDKPSGKWINISYYDNGYGVNKTCSICNHTISGQGYNLSEYKYCPSCGGKMESEDKG